MQIMANDYISREAVFELIENAPIVAGNENDSLISAPELSDKVYCIPAADVRPVVRGEWWSAYGHVMCSDCHKIELHKTDFCPNCGADMREEGGRDDD